MTIPVLILGGAENALAVARSLSRYGVPVSVSTQASQAVRWSRCFKHGYFSAPHVPIQDYWTELLLRSETAPGSIILTCSDDAVQFVAANHDALRRHYILEENRPELQLALLDKQKTLVLAKNAGLDVPWHSGSSMLTDEEITQAGFPVLVKPIHSHLYVKVFHKKLRCVNNPAELREHLREVNDAGLQVMLCELVPGEDDRLCSYYTYVDRSGACLFDFTKKVIRRTPKQFGAGCYHATEWLPDVAEAGRRFFTSIGYRGLANIEFKRDPRDNKLKVMESNPRFTAAHKLLIASGMDTARIVYDILAGRQPRIPAGFKEGKTLLYPVEDFSEFLQRKSRHEMTFRQWFASVARPQQFPFFEWSDPLPATVLAIRWIRRAFANRLG